MTTATLETGTTVEARTRQAATVLERCVCLTLSCHYLGNSRKIDLGELVEASGGTLAVDSEQFHAVKRLVDNAELRPAMRLLAKAKDVLRGHAISGHRVFGERSYLVPLPMVDRVDEQLRHLQAELRCEARLLAARYSDARDQQREKLGALFQESDYPTTAEVAAAFDIDWDYVSFATPDRLVSVNTALYERARAREEDRLATAYDEVRGTLRGVLHQITSDLVARLTPEPGAARRKAIRGTALDDLTGYLETFSLRNITDDDELEAVVGDLRRLAAGADVDALREDVGLRETVTAAATAAVARLETLTTRGRAIELE